MLSCCINTIIRIKLYFSVWSAGCKTQNESGKTNKTWIKRFLWFGVPSPNKVTKILWNTSELSCRPVLSRQTADCMPHFWHAAGLASPHPLWHLSSHWGTQRAAKVPNRLSRGNNLSASQENASSPVWSYVPHRVPTAKWSASCDWLNILLSEYISPFLSDSLTAVSS